MKTIVSLAIAAYAAHSAIAGTNPIEQLSAGQWLELPNTKIRNVLPVPLPHGNPRYLVEAWSGGAVDSKRSRLIVWGGGGSDYFGNELYAVDLNTRKVERLTDPSLSSFYTDRPAKPDGAPVSRHTYGGVTYIAHADRLFAYGGAIRGYFEQDTWTFDFKTSRWHEMKPSGPVPRGDPGIMADYDPVTKKVYVKDNVDLYSYSFEANSYTLLAKSPVGYRMSGAIDPKRRKFVMLGDGDAFDIDLSTHAMKKLVTRGGDAVINSDSPGLAYDPVADRMVAWSGGNTVYALNLDTGVWTSAAHQAGPNAEQTEWGTFGRWGYVPEFGVFVLVNDIDRNGYVFKLSPSRKER
ncbi:MAG: kelch repeat-containing protein [Burkholderiales bacterium]